MKPIIRLLEMGMDGASKRQKALANNIANVNTPHYKRKDVDFMSNLKAAVDGNSKLSLHTTDKDHIDSTGARPFKTIPNFKTNYRNDKNNVDIDTEMAELAKNNIYYSTLVQQLNERFKNMRDVINKGGR